MIFLLGLLSVLPLTAQFAGLTEEQHLKLQNLVAESPIFQKGFTGFSLYDPEQRAFLYTHQADQYFTPASNTKILTFFTSVNLLGTGMPALFYQDRGDTLYCWGTGYPLLLHPDFGPVDTLWRWLRAQNKPIVYSDATWRDLRFGSGWSWDDYADGYQMEKAALPIYGNVVRFRKSNQLGRLVADPSRLAGSLVYQEDRRSYGSPVLRAEDQNIFYFNQRALRSSSLVHDVPFRYSPYLLADLLADTLRRSVIYRPVPLPPRGTYQVLNVPVPDTLYRRMMQDSDNYLAEQLILLCSAARYRALNSEWVIDYARDTMLAGLPKPIDWVDGSGLSRYNQFTPRSVVMVLEQLYRLLPRERLFSYFAAGGRSGTIRGNYAGPKGQPYVFAKTGTLRHVHCLSGYVVTESGRTLLFSFMHNNYPDAISELRSEMNKVLRWVYDEVE